MNKKIVLAVVGVSLSFAASVAQASPAQMKPGLWEITVVNQAPGTTNRRSTVSQVCYRAEDFKVPQKLLPPQGDFGMVCDAKEYKVAGDKATWRAVCTGKGGKSVSGLSEMIATATSYSGSANVESKADGKTSKLKQTLSGKRLGECK